MEQDKNKIEVKNLLKVYSIEEISDLFSTIDKKILELHEYSSEDFLNLNNDFKSYYKSATKISENASYLFRFLADQENHYLPADIKGFHNDLRTRNILLEEQLEASNKVISNLLSKVRQAFFPIKNFKQNLTSLRFLETNLELDYSLGNGLEPQAIAEISNKTKEQLTYIEKSFNKLKQLIKTNLLEEQNLYSEELNIKNVLDNLEKDLADYRDHYEKARKQIPEIQDRTEQTRESISKIITNLQYHDIIKQKMQHIQKTHKDLVSEMEALHEEENASDANTNAKYFIRIRDIAGLQAAQLLQTNKEYQTAIQRISDKLLEIGENMTLVAKQCTEYTSFDYDRQKIFFESLKMNLGIAKEKIQSFCDFNERFNSNIQDISKILDNTLQFNRNISLLIEDIKKFIDLKEKKYDSPDGNEEDIFRQIIQLYNDLKSNKNNLDVTFGEIQALKETLDALVKKSTQDVQTEATANLLPGKIEQYMNGLNEVEKEILDKLTENNELSETILSDIQKSVGNIKYYDYFERIIEEIIDELNTINYKLRFDEENIRNKEDNLKRLTEYYTMNSEYVIHNQVLEGNDSEIEVSEDGGDLELF